ncbi:hypothetical protein FRX31_025391, partial [Thalictrum thalictroides]
KKQNFFVYRYTTIRDKGFIIGNTPGQIPTKIFPYDLNLWRIVFEIALWNLWFTVVGFYTHYEKVCFFRQTISSSQILR